MKKVIGFLLVVVAVAGVSAFCAMRFSSSCNMCSDKQSDCSAHDWLHQKLKLSADQQKALEPIETRFHADYQQASTQLTEANRELARILGEAKTFSPEVVAAIEKVHHRMGELQKLSVQHLYDMRPILSAEQNDRLVQYAQQALLNNP